MSTPPFGAQSMVDPLRRVLVKRPEDDFAVADPAAWHYAGRPDLGAARREHEELVAVLAGCSAEVVEHPEPQPGRADALFVFAPARATGRGEEDALARRLRALGIPILATRDGEARAEGGDLLWLDRGTLAAGQGFRT